MDSRRLEVSFFIALLLGVLLLSFLVFRPYVGPIALALTFAITVRPVYQSLVRLVRFKGLASILTVIVVVFLILTPVSFLGYRIVDQATQLYSNLASPDRPGLSGTISGFIEDNVERFVPAASVNVNEYARQGLTWLIQNLGSFFSGLAQVFVTLFIALFGLYYLLKDGPEFRRRAIELLPLERRYAELIFSRMEEGVNTVIRGILLIAVIQGIVTGLGLSLFGVPNAALWGSLAVFAALVPTIGTSLINIPAIAFLFLTGNVPQAIGLLIWAFFAVGLIDNFLTPQLLRRGIKIHPFIILLSVLGGLGLFGPIGFLIGPLVIALLVALLEIYPEILNQTPGR